MQEEAFVRRQVNPFHRFFDRVWYLVKLHLAIVLGTVLGLGVLGFFPSLFAAAELIDELLAEGEGYVFEPFFLKWRAHFRAANLFGLFVVLGLGLAYGLWYLLWYVRTPLLATLANTLFILASIGFLIIVIYYPVLRLHFTRWTQGKLLSYTLLFGLGHFLTTLILLALAIGWGLFAAFLPQYAIFVLFSVLPYVTVVLTRKRLGLPSIDPNTGNIRSTSS